MAAMSGPAHGRGVLLHHLGQGLDPGQKTKPIHAEGDPVQAELDSAMKRIGELTMQVELLEAKTETFGPLGRRRSRR